MLTIILGLTFIATVSTVFILFPLDSMERPRLQPLLGTEAAEKKKPQKRFHMIRQFAIFNRPLCLGPLGRRISRDLNIGKVDISPEEFILMKEIAIGGLLFFTFPMIQPDMIFFWLAMGFSVGYMIPEFWLKQKVKKVKDIVIKELPDVIDLLGLCVNAGLDFMLALKWVVEKSKQTVLIEELNLIMQEINVGKSRRMALSDLSKKYELPDVSTFTRTLIQADRMGTSVAEALNILSEDMRLARFRRGEQFAMKAPMKMLVPLLLFIFPVVGILVAAPVFLDFMNNNPLANIAGASPVAP